MAKDTVYVINNAASDALERKSPAVSAGTPPTGRGADRRPPKNWIGTLRAYALGPVSLILSRSGPARMVWAVAAGISLVATIVLILQWNGLIRALTPFQHGAVIWAVMVAFVIQFAATTWARSIAASAPVKSWPGALRSKGLIGVLGLVLPGLGLLIAGRRWRAACALWSAGFVVAGIAILAKWRWLASHYDGMQAGANPADSVLLIAAVAATIGGLAWLIQALDGIRMVSSSQRNGALANALGLVMVIVLVLGLATLRPKAVASELSAVAAPLSTHGLRQLPLMLYNAASSLDPATPVYLTAAENINEELGRAEAAQANRLLLEQRATRFANAVGAELTPRREEDVSATSFPVDYDWATAWMTDRTSPIPK